MRLDHTLITLSGLANSVIVLYAGRTSSYKSPPIEEEILAIFGCAILPAAMMLLPARGRKNASGLINFCATIILLSGMFFTYLYANERDVSRAFIIGIHFLITYFFAFVSLCAPAEKNVASKQ